MGVPVIVLGRHDLQASHEGTVTAKTCKKCGAPLRDNKCEYCGTEYEGAKDHAAQTDDRKVQT